MYNLKELSSKLNGKIIGDESLKIYGLAPFNRAQKTELTFVAEEKFVKKIDETKAGAIITPPLSIYNPEKTYIVVEKNPRELMPIILNYFKRPLKFQEKMIEDSVVIGKGTKVGPNVSISHDAVIGDNVVLYPGVVIGEGVVIGDNTIVYSNVSIREFTVIGPNCVIQPGAVIGSDGFGFTKVDGNNIKIEQIGRVVLEEHVEVGANTTIDRGAIGDTVIGRYTKIDNLTQIAHNVVLGENNYIISQVGIAGSTEIGNNCTIAGQVGIAGHLKIGDNVTLGAQSGVSGNIGANQVLSGNPPIDIKSHLRVKASIKKLPALVKEIKEMKKNLKKNS